MAINLKFDLIGNPEPPSIVLANRNGNKLGQLDVNAESIDVKDLLATSEFTFTLNKYVDGKITNLWDKVLDFKLVYCPEWDLWYEIKVELDEATETVKTVFCVQLGQAELSQIMVYNTEINTEADIERDDYKISILYDEDNPDASIFHRVMSKAPHYSIAHVDESLKRIQKSFSFNDSSICDVFDEIEEEVGCLVVYNSNSDKGGKPKRDISIYDLYQHCDDCGHREEFIGDECPKCHSKRIIDGYGEDTTIFVTSDELATKGIQLVTDVDSVKNCFKLEAGDDLMTATIRNCNPNGSDYIWYFSDSLKEDMSDELVEKLESYDDKYQEYYKEQEYALDESLVSQYDTLVNKYQNYYNTKSTCINCKYEGYFENECPSCHSKNILSGKNLQTINSVITGYPDLMTAYYNTIDLELYLESGLMPTVEMSDTTAEEQLELLTTLSLSPVAVNAEKMDSVSLSTADSAVLSMAKVIVRPTYKVEIKSSTLSDDNIWSGQFTVTNYSDDADTATNNNAITVVVNNDTEEFIKQKIEKALNKKNTDDLSISGLFNEEKYNYNEFCNELKKYALNPLKSFYDACDDCLSILTVQGAGNENEKPDLYESLYEPYYNKSLAIAEEIKTREDEIAIIVELQKNIADIQSQIQEALDFEKHLGEDLWLEFCAYRREDKYSNNNYISDGLNNAELFAKANEFIEVAEEEIFKSAELQHSISATLNNLLSLPKFKHLIKSFKTGNWIRVQVDDKIYKLRLLEYDFSYGDSQNISVEFSDVTKVKNGITDLQDVVSQTASMASSYDSVQRQAQKGDVARSTIDQWLVDGLKSADVQIKNNDSEEVLITKNGLLARSYDDITDSYSPEQLKVTHNIMAYTKDNWETVSTALGKHDYQKWENNQWVTDTDYGLSSKFVTAGYVTGSQIIGGEIVSSNYKTEKEKGTYINLLNGDFEFAGGKIFYDSNKNKVTLSGVTIQWDNVNKPTVENIDGLSGITDDIRAIEQGLNATTINGQYVISPHIVGGDIKIVSNNGKTSAEISNSGMLTATGANISGDITATSLTLGSDVKISTSNIDGIDEYAKIDDITGVPENIITADDVSISSTTSANGVTTQTITVGDNEYTSIVSGDFVFTDIGLGTNTDDGSKRYTCIGKDGLLTAKNAIIYGTIFATDGRFTGDIVADSLTLRQQIQIGNEEDGYHTWISPDGVLTTHGANISNNFTAVNGTIGNCSIGDCEITNASIGDCEITGGSLKMGNIEDGYSAWISVDEGILNANGVNISGTINAVDGVIAGWQVTEDALYKNTNGTSSGMCSIKLQYSEGLEYTLSDDESYYIVSGIGTCSDVDIVIPDTYDNTPVTEIGIRAFYGNKDVKSVRLSNNITMINDYAFYNCDNLENIIITDSVTHIGNFSFSICDKLTSAFIPSNVTNIGEGAFSSCTNLEEVIISNNVINIGFGAFYGNKIVCCEAESKPDGWDSSWAISVEEIRWGYKVDNIFASLVTDGESSCPRFFAGSRSRIPNNSNDAKFLVLEDGSLYASAAKINGSGVFDGEIYARNGEIGGLFFDEQEISSGDGGLTFTQDGLVKAKNLEISNYFKADNLQIGKISGRQDGSAVLNFEDAATDSRNVEVTFSIEVVDKGSSGFFGLGFDEGKMVITATSNHTLSKSKTFTVVLQYNIFGSHNVTNKTITMTIQSGKKSVSKSVAYRVGTDSYDYCTLYMVFIENNYGNYNSIDTIQTVNYTEILSSSTNAITSSGSITPIDTDGNLSLGSNKNPWGNIYAKTSYFLDGTIFTSDKNKKNTINPIDEQYSILFDLLRTKTFKLNEGASNRTHIGLIAQEVKEAMDCCGIDSQDFAAYCSWKDDSGNDTCGIRYEELVSLCIDQIQKLKKRVAELESKL